MKNGSRLHVKILIYLFLNGEMYFLFLFCQSSQMSYSAIDKKSIINMPDFELE